MSMILGYVRVSTQEQAADGRTSLRQQRRLIEGFAAFAGVRGAYDFNIFEDAGVSGSIPLSDRPAGADLMAAAKHGDTVVSAKLDRIFRNSLDALTVFSDFKKRGIKLVLMDLGTDDIIDGKGVGKIIFSIMSAFADHERERICDRMSEGKRAKLAAGGHAGGVAPYGYRIIGAGREARLEEVPEEKEMLDKVRAWFLDYEARRISPERYRLGILRLLRRGGYKTRTGKHFSAEQVQRLIDRTAHAVH